MRPHRPSRALQARKIKKVMRPKKAVSDTKSRAPGAPVARREKPTLNSARASLLQANIMAGHLPLSGKLHSDLRTRRAQGVDQPLGDTSAKSRIEYSK